jgi:hypothetical protein
MQNHLIIAQTHCLNQIHTGLLFELLIITAIFNQYLTAPARFKCALKSEVQ